MKNTDGTEVWRPSSEPQQNTVRVEIPLHVPGCIADMPEAELLKRSKAKRCWICGNKLRSGRNYPQTIDGHKRDLHKFCGERHKKTEARSDNAFGLEY